MTERLASWRSGVAPAGLLPLAGCGGEPAEEAPLPPPPVAELARPLTPDEQLAEDVRRALEQAPALQKEKIRIAASNGLVLLMGEVSAPHLRDEAVAVAGEVPGVQSVDSKLNVRAR